MPPKRKSKANLAEVGTPKTSAAPAPGDDAMEIDTPQAAETPRAAETPTVTKSNLPTTLEVLNDPWTEDQISSLLKAIIIWKPTGIHKHFRMIAISEHLRNHGIDPDAEPHTRIPGIRKKLAEFFNMEKIDERDNAFDYLKEDGGDEAAEDVYKSFDLPPDDFHDLMWARAMADPNKPDEQSEQSDSAAGVKGTAKKAGSKRKRGNTSAADGSSVAGSSTTKTRRSSTVDDTDQETPFPSSPVGKSARGARSRKRAATKAKVKGDADLDDEEDEEEADDDEEEEEDEDSEDEEEEEKEAPATRGRGTAARGRGRGRGRGKASRKKA
ncbi:Uu.00g023790.m01.CDS01 [Anthostomella pinea]|uniref:Uu.00g023790.m01.CDS01 n=1 Tax=Anthostomella pinea TaxID=933095 RepID=A0AAI8W0M7_9PEZI|nr:Uu.00g023790.m01.CDS01 [Anthostomella pinea]